MNKDDILVRIAVGMADDGTWVAVGDSTTSDDEKVNFLRQVAPIAVNNVYFVEALVPSIEIIGQLAPEALVEDTVNAS